MDTSAFCIDLLNQCKIKKINKVIIQFKNNKQNTNNIRMFDLKALMLIYVYVHKYIMSFNKNNNGVLYIYFLSMYKVL